MYLPNSKDVTQHQFFSRVQMFCIQIFIFSRLVALPTLKIQSALLFTHISGFILFQMVLALYEMQIASSRTWTRVNKFISYENNWYTTSNLSVELNTTE